MAASSRTASTSSDECNPMNSVAPQKMTGLHGRVTLGSYGKNSKSEREAFFIETADARYILRRKTGPAFGDEEIGQFKGQNVKCDGFLVGTTLLAERIETVDINPARPP